MMQDFWGKAASGARSADAWIAAEARKRQLDAMKAGINRNVDYVMSRPAETVASRLATDLGKDGNWRDQMASALGGQGAGQTYARQSVADAFGPQMNRGPMQMGQMGVLEALNRGIAENRYIRRGALPAAIAVGGVMGGVGVTAAAQRLAALTGHMQEEQDRDARAAQSPLIAQQPPLA